MARKSDQIAHREAVSDSYLNLVRAFPLRPIHSDAELEHAISMINSLLDRDDLGPDDQDYLDVLGDLVEKYESEHYPILPVSDAEMLSHLIEARGVTPAIVAEATGIAESTTLEILAGQRGLDRNQVGALSRYFQVNPAVFLAV
ncbi:MAG: transcriptional regulator [Isosphaeraceae bacterium]